MATLRAHELRAFILGVARYLLAQQPELAPMLRSIEACVAASDSMPGLREAARDMVEWSQDLQGQSLVELDDRLASAGLPTLTEMRAA